MDYNLIQEGPIYPDAALDVLTTVKYYRDHAQDYNIDPEKYSIEFEIRTTGSSHAWKTKVAGVSRVTPKAVSRNLGSFGKYCSV